MSGPNQQVVRALERAGARFEVIDCDPALADTADFCAHYGYALDDSVNTILVKAKTGGERFVACVLLAPCRLDVNRVVRKRLEARRVSFASASETERLTGMTVGGVTPIALPDAVPVWVDRRVLTRPRVVLGGGDRAHKIIVEPEIFATLPNTEVVVDLALPPT